jgi:decaprenylphospho-beta-D-erythro-pentofuranosid-2-ulose 2-reductase
MNKDPVLILGGRSDIGLATAHQFAAAGHAIQLAARDVKTLGADRDDIALRHSVAVTLHEFDALDTNSHAAFLDGLEALPDVAVCAIGMLGDQDENERDLTAAIQVMRSNFEGPASILSLLANRFEARGRGTLVGISSVAGDRGRATNYIYGSSKAGFTAFLSGLRNRLVSSNVHVVTILPGFVATRMTEGMDLPEKLTASPQALAEAIEKAVISKKNIIYVKPIWALIMMIIRNIPEQMFKKKRI